MLANYMLIRKSLWQIPPVALKEQKYPLTPKGQLSFPERTIENSGMFL